MKLEALTPRDDLHGKEKSFKVYKDYLDEAFDNPKIRNLALSGSLGSGKSSIIRSYDRARNYGKKHFLYVSLMSFSNQVDGTATDDQKQLEYSLLNQIMSCCTAKDLPEGSIKGIPENFKWLRTCAVCLSMLCLSIYMLIFHEQFGIFAGMLFIKLEGKTFLGFELSNLFSEGARSWVHLGLYVLIGVILCICVYCILCRCLPFFQLSKLTVKSNNAEAEVLMGKERTSLDVYKFELTYALEKIGKKYDYTVVFEDLERLDPNVAVDIMEKLRELNTLTNNHIQASKVNNIFKRIRWWAYAELKRKDDKYSRYFDELASRGLVRFVYAISDSTLSIEHRTKFYDCIIPIVPVSNPLNSKKYLLSMLTEFNILEYFPDELCNLLSKSILDYRTHLTLKNEFSVMWELYAKENFPAPLEANEEYIQKARERWETNPDTTCNKATMFAIAVYKILLPLWFEYALSSEGTGILPSFSSPAEETHLNEYLKQADTSYTLKAVRALFKCKRLDDGCLQLIIGKEQLAEHWLKLLQNALDKPSPTDEDMALADKVISAIEKIPDKPIDKNYWTNYHTNMTTTLGTLESANQEAQFMLIARSLVVTSRPPTDTYWEWLISASSKVFFRNCIKFLVNSPKKPTIPPYSHNMSFVDWCTAMLDKYQNAEMCVETGWDDKMAYTLAWYLNFADPQFRINYKKYAAYTINGQTLAQRILSITTD